MAARTGVPDSGGGKILLKDRYWNNTPEKIILRVYRQLNDECTAEIHRIRCHPRLVQPLSGNHVTAVAVASVGATNVLQPIALSHRSGRTVNLLAVQYIVDQDQHLARDCNNCNVVVLLALQSSGEPRELRLIHRATCRRLSRNSGADRKIIG